MSTGIDESFRALVQARREELQAGHTIDLDVPGWEGVLRARYRPVDWREMRRIGARVNRDRSNVDDFTRELYVAADTIVAACEEVLKPNGAGWKGTGQRWSAELAHALGIEDPQTPRQAIFALFGSDRLVARHFAELNAWMEGENREVDHELVGESEPPRSSS